mgnify:CR=1 FL=1
MKIIGQDQTLNEISRIFEIFKSSQQEIKPHFILAGASGSGKTLLINALSEQYELAFLEINAAQLTKEGVSGNSLSKALAPLKDFANKPTVVFVDEWDKLFISGNSNSNKATESTTEVQNEFLKILEGDAATVFGSYGSYDSVSIRNILFVFAGAFNNEPDVTLDRLREMGVKTEFLGRVGLIFNTTPLTVENLYTILEQSDLLEKYNQLFSITDKQEIVEKLKYHINKNFEMNTLGARMVNTLIHQYFIKGGKIEEEVCKTVTFQSKLSL